MIYYIRPSKKRTRSHARNVVWRIINHGLLPGDHQDPCVYVQIDSRDLNAVMTKVYAHPKWKRITERA